MAGRSRGLAFLGLTLVLAGLAGGLAWILLGPSDPGARPVPPASEFAPPAQPPSVADVPQAPPSDPPEPTARRRVPVPRPARAQPPAPPQGAHTDTDLAPVDTDFPAVVGGAELGEALTAALARVQPELVDCLDGWVQLQPDVFEGRAVFILGMDQQGVHTIDITDVQSVPEPTLQCLGDVMWDQVDWPAVDQPIEVSWPVQLSVDDDG